MGRVFMLDQSIHENDVKFSIKETKQGKCQLHLSSEVSVKVGYPHYDNMIK